MAGSITVLPARRTGFGDFVDALKPGLEKAFNIYLSKQLEEQQYQKGITRQEQERKKRIEQTRQMFPDYFTETTPVSEYQKLLPQGTSLSVAGGLTPERQTEVSRQLTQAKGIQMPENIRNFIWNKEKLGTMQPTIDVATGGVTLKPEDAFNAYYRSLLPKQTGAGGVEDNIIYRNSAGVEVPKEQAQADITSGNTNYFISKKEITRSGIKETPIAKPEDLQKSQAINEKNDFILNQTQDALNTIAEVEKGIGHFGLFGQIPSIPGTTRYTWETNINKLLSEKMIELMTQMKEASKTGATGFGQLSEKEGQILREASTAIKRGLPPKKAQEYLNVMKSALKKVLSGTNVQPQGQQPQTEDLEYQKYLQAIGGQ